MHVQRPDFADPKKIGTSFLPAEACSYRAKNKRSISLLTFLRHIIVIGFTWQKVIVDSYALAPLNSLRLAALVFNG